MRSLSCAERRGHTLMWWRILLHFSLLFLITNVVCILQCAFVRNCTPPFNLFSLFPKTFVNTACVTCHDYMTDRMNDDIFSKTPSNKQPHVVVKLKRKDTLVDMHACKHKTSSSYTHGTLLHGVILMFLVATQRQACKLPLCTISRYVLLSPNS